ncbi:MAG TPA: ABC transporter ATP-binding protein [Lachnoclostridium phytofermentans]|uniref:ABC transporter ATP-binding protein n=1 Tax=Lachnoclostridium phytofermentans TaxID=66219 RepID=A0A3D2X981_9FIRM|nr:ABC transporter ATP-binding protein [Lachnoclostridium sp.]HCL03153.1 ABC transporter ATP-binding protein [Lachnoclostridium phytofermentans]
MSQNRQAKKVIKPDSISSYFKLEIWPLSLVTISGILYNIGMIAGPYFEGQLAQCLFDIMKGYKTFSAIVSLAITYLVVIFVVQLMRCIKRFYVRRFANETSCNMRHMLYNSLVNMNKDDLESESLGAVMTKAVADVDACVEGMRKFTTEVFDTGVVLIAYLSLLFFYDWRLALLSSIFTPIAYYIAGRLKNRITRYNAEYKKSAGRLNNATMDRVLNAVTYRVYGCEPNRDNAYESYLKDYEKRAVSANLWESAMQPIYNIISMCGAVLIIYLGAKNVLGTGWVNWNIAAFTTVLSCFTKMALKSSKAAKLFNSVQKAQVSWARIKPLMKEYVEQDTDSTIDFSKPVGLTVSNLSLYIPSGSQILENISFSATPGQIIGVTGPVACGKSMLGKAFIGEVSYEGSIRVGEQELASLSDYERSRLISYMGHQPELISDSIEENICLGEQRDILPYLKAVCFEKEVTQMPQGADTLVGSSGIRLSGGQQARTALARTLYNAQHILILDDPFSAVDRETEQEIFENLRTLAADKVVILFSHRLSLFSKFDKVLFLNGGKGIYSTHDELMLEHETYAELYHAQVVGGGQNEE